MADSTRAHAAIRASWSVGPSRAKLWPRTASTAVAVRDGPSITTPTSVGDGRGPERHGPRGAGRRTPSASSRPARERELVPPRGRPDRFGSGRARRDDPEGGRRRTVGPRPMPGPTAIALRAAATARPSARGLARTRRPHRPRRPPGRPERRPLRDWTAGLELRPPGWWPPWRSARPATRRSPRAAPTAKSGTGPGPDGPRPQAPAGPGPVRSGRAMGLVTNLMPCRSRPR